MEAVAGVLRTQPSMWYHLSGVDVSSFPWCRQHWAVEEKASRPSAHSFLPFARHESSQNLAHVAAGAMRPRGLHEGSELAVKAQHRKDGERMSPASPQEAWGLGSSSDGVQGCEKDSSLH